MGFRANAQRYFLGRYRRTAREPNLHVTTGFHKRSEDDSFVSRGGAGNHLCSVPYRSGNLVSARPRRGKLSDPALETMSTHMTQLLKNCTAASRQKESDLAEEFPHALPLPASREDPAFQGKRPSHPLILADFLAFMTKRKLMEDPRSNNFSPPWWKRNAGLRITVPEFNA